MMKFASFETIVEMIYGYMPKKKSEYGRGTQTAVSFAGGYAGKLLPEMEHLSMDAEIIQRESCVPWSLTRPMLW